MRKNIKNNIDELKDGSIRFENPFLSFASEDTICKQMIKAFPDIPKEEVRAAVKTGWQELAAQGRRCTTKAKKL